MSTGSKKIKKFIIENWLIKRNQPGSMSIIAAQTQQAGARVIFAIAGLVYLQQHAIFFTEYQTPFLYAAGIYFLYNLLSIAAIKRRPLSAFRSLFAPAFDVAIVCFAAIIDGGHSSGLYFMLLVIIFGNGFRYGNALLLYSQAIATLGLIAVAIYTLFNMHLDLDRALLVWQLAGLLAIPTYIYLIGEKAETAIQGQHEAEAASFSLLDHGPLPVFTYDLDGKNQPRVLYANAAIGEVFRDDYTRLIGEQPDMLALLEDGEEMLEFCRQTLLTNHPSAVGHEDEKKSIYIRGRDRKDNILRLMCNTTRMRWRNQWIGVCFILDITQREATQAKLEAVHRQGYMSTMVAGIVHDFRNVLTTMIGYAEVLSMDENNLNKGQLQAIIDAGDRGSAMISHLLTLGRNDEVEQHPNTNGDQLQGPLENILGLSRLQLPAHIQLHCNIENPLPDVHCSILEIEQMLLNLTHNAAAAIRNQGQITVHIFADKQHKLARKDAPALCMKVTDNGIGIAAEDIDNIFKPFWTSRKKEGGSGLGLAMVQRIVKLRHGSIEVDSKPGQGTTFTIHLAPHADESSSKPKQGATAIPIPAIGKKSAVKTDAKPAPPCRILLVDDAPDVLKIHKALLSRLHHESITAENGQQAMDIFLKDTEHFELIITDHRMPVMNGLEFIQGIRQLNANIPIIMITAFGEDEQLQQAVSLGALLVNKPVTLDKLRECIDTALQTPSR